MRLQQHICAIHPAGPCACDGGRGCPSIIGDRMLILWAMRLCACVRSRPESHRGRVPSHTAIHRPDEAVWFSPNQRTETGLSSWDILWVDPGPAAEAQLRSFLLEDAPPREVLISGPCGALTPGQKVGAGVFANEVLDPDRGPHRPVASRAIGNHRIQTALGVPLTTGKFLTTAVPCITPSHKLESGHGYGAIAVDQDSALLCRPCVELDLAHAVMRFILDPAEVDLSPESPGGSQALAEGARTCERALFRMLAAL